MLKSLFSIFLLCSVLFLHAQQFGGHPPSQKWMQVGVENKRVIFPTGWDSIAKRVASLVTQMDHFGDSSIGKKRMPVNILLQHQTTESNGYVALAPFRSEFMMTPPANPFDLGALSWPDQLTLHEWRHVQQYSNFNRGLAKAFRVLLGQQGQALANALGVPDWFFEGDAVFHETRLSAQGRGRMPSFFNGYRAIWEAGTNYSYMKLRNGSFRHYVPNHYELGYQLVAYVNEHRPEGTWKKISEDAAAMKGVFYPFQRAVKKHTGLGFEAFIDSALGESRNRFGAVPSGKVKHSPVVRHEENPLFTEDGSLLLLKSSYSKVPAFYRRKNGKDHFIRTRDIVLNNYYAYSNGRIVYASYRPDTRWGWRDYSELQVLDVKTGKQQRITRGTKYFSPAFSASGDSIVAVEVLATGRSHLHILNRNGQLLTELANPRQYYFSHPVFRQGRIITAARDFRGRMALLEIEPTTGEEQLLVEWSNNLIGYPSVQADTVFFTMTHEGRDQLFRLVIPGKSIYRYADQEERSKTGLYQPSAQGDSMVYMQFTAAGYKVRYSGRFPGDWVPADTPSTSELFGFGLSSLDSAQHDFTSAPSVTQSYNAGPYRKTTRFFNFHSWQPFYEEPEFSFTLIGQNILNTMRSEVFFLYNRNEGFKQVGASGLYGGWFPYINAGINYTFDRRARYDNRVIYWNEFEARTGFLLPFNLGRGRSISYLSAGSDIVYDKPYFNEPEKSALGDLSNVYLDHNLRFSHQVQQARQHVSPRWAQVTRLQYRHALNRYKSHQLMATGSFYFPGLFHNHSLMVSIAGQQRDSSAGVRFTNNFPFARGYEDENYFRTAKWAVNYQLPLAYPDAGAWNIVYLLRLRNNFFYDHAWVKDPQLLGKTGPVLFRSVGTELFFDTRWWNQLPVSFGIRYARLLDDDVYGGSGSNRWEFILPVNLIPGGLQSKKKNPAF